MAINKHLLGMFVGVVCLIAAAILSHVNNPALSEQSKIMVSLTRSFCFGFGLPNLIVNYFFYLWINAK